MGMFSDMDVDLNEQHSTKGGNYFKPGVYTCKLLEVKTFEYGGHDGDRKDTAWAAEFEILESNNEEHPVGDRPSHFVGISKSRYKKTALSNIADAMRAFVACSMACEGEEVPPIETIEMNNQLADAICAEDQPLAGTIVKVIATNIVTKTGNDFTKINYAVPENAAALFGGESAAA